MAYKSITEGIEIPNLGAGIAAGQNAYNNFLAVREEQRKNATAEALAQGKVAHEQAVRQAASSFAKNRNPESLEALRVLDADLALNMESKFREFQSGDLKFSEDLSKFRQAETKRVNEVVLQAFKPAMSIATALMDKKDLFAKNPGAYEGMIEAYNRHYAAGRAALMKAAEKGEVPKEFANLSEIVDPEALDLMQRDIAKSYQGAKGAENFERTAATRVLAASDPLAEDESTAIALGLGDKLDQITQDAKAAEEAGKDRRAAMMSPTGAEQTKLQDSQRLGQETMMMINSMLDKAKEAPASYFGPAGAKASELGQGLASIAALAGAEAYIPQRMEDWLSERQVFTGLSRLITSSELRHQSGLAMTQSERDYLTAAIGDPDKMTKQSYFAALTLMKDVLSGRVYSSHDLLVNGFGDPTEALKRRLPNFKTDLDTEQKATISPDETFRIMEERAKRKATSK